MEMALNITVSDIFEGYPQVPVRESLTPWINICEDQSQAQLPKRYTAGTSSTSGSTHPSRASFENRRSAE